MVVADGGDIVGTFAYNAWPRGPRKWLDPGPYGTLGVGGGFALGAATAFPKTVSTHTHTHSYAFDVSRLLLVHRL